MEAACVRARGRANPVVDMDRQTDMDRQADTDKVQICK